MSMDCDVLVVGGGMIGLACALGLSQRGFQVRVAEPSPISKAFPSQGESFEPKVVAISRSTQRLCEQLGIWSSIEASRISAYDQMVVWDSVADGRIQFCAAELFEPNLGYIIEQRVITAALWAALRCHGVEILAQTLRTHQLASDRVDCVLDHTKLSARLVIAADGADSMLRKQSRISSRGWDYQQTAIVACVTGQKSHQRTAFQRFAPDGPLALLPLSDPYQCAIVWTTTPDAATRLQGLPDEAFGELLSRETDGVMGTFSRVAGRKTFPLRTHHADTYVAARRVLVGDAAHTVHPLAGQGANLGFADVNTLIQVLADARARGRDFSAESVLRRYQRRRRWHNQAMIWAMEAFKRGFGASSPWIQQARNAGLNWVHRHRGLKHLFARMALGTEIRMLHVQNDRTL